MMKLGATLVAATIALGMHSASAATITDVVNSGAGTKFNQTVGKTDDFGWQHTALTTTFDTASLTITAFDVDYYAGYWKERNEVFAYDSSASEWVLLGALAGVNEDWLDTTFVLGSRFYDDIANGLQIYIDFDTKNRTWKTNISQSVVTLYGAPDPQIPAVPLPAAAPLIGSALLAMGALGLRRRKN